MENSSIFVKEKFQICRFRVSIKIKQCLSKTEVLPFLYFYTFILQNIYLSGPYDNCVWQTLVSSLWNVVSAEHCLVLEVVERLLGVLALALLLLLLPLLTNPVLSDCENSEADEVDSSGGSSGATFNETHEVGGDTLEEDDAEEEEESEDAEEAFNDLEDETMLCADYVPQTRNKRLPDAIIIGARKVNTNDVILIKSIKEGEALFLRDIV